MLFQVLGSQQSIKLLELLDSWPARYSNIFERILTFPGNDPLTRLGRSAYIDFRGHLDYIVERALADFARSKDSVNDSFIEARARQRAMIKAG